MKQLFIIHGYQANPNSHWFNWIAQKIQHYGYTTDIIELPNPHKPEYHAWYDTLKHHMDHELNDQTIIIAHSLGVITTLNYLARLSKAPNIKALILISGFHEKLRNLPELDAFISQTIVSNINVQHILALAATNDPIVDNAASNRLSQLLNINTINIEHDGHFLAEEGYTSFEFLWTQLQHILNNKKD